MGQILDNTASISIFYNNGTISTRGHCEYHLRGELTPQHNTTDYVYYNNISLTTNKIICPSQKEIAIYIHGAWNDATSANEQFNRTAMSLTSNNYTILLVGFSWDQTRRLTRMVGKLQKL